MTDHERAVKWATTVVNSGSRGVSDKFIAARALLELRDRMMAAEEIIDNFTPDPWPEEYRAKYPEAIK